MSLNATNLNLNAIFSLLGNLSANKTESESNHEESIFSSLPKENLLGENGLNQIESPVKILLLLLSSILGLDSNKDKEETRADDSNVRRAASSRRRRAGASSRRRRASLNTNSDEINYNEIGYKRKQKEMTATNSTEKTGTTKTTFTEEVYIDETSTAKTIRNFSNGAQVITTGKKDPYEKVSSASAVEKFRDENPELFDENISPEDYNKTFDELAQKGTVVKHEDHTFSDSNENHDAQEVTVIDVGNGIYLHIVKHTFDDGTTSENRRIKVGSNLTISDNVATQTISSNLPHGEGPKDSSDKTIETLERQGYN